MVWSLDPLTTVIGVQWSAGYFYRMVMVNTSPEFVCVDAVGFTTQVRNVFAARALSGGEYPELIGGDPIADIVGNQFLGIGFTDFVPFDDPAPECQEYFPGIYRCGVRTYGEPDDGGFDHFAAQAAAIWAASGVTPNSQTIRAGFQIGVHNYDPLGCDMTGIQCSWEIFAETWEMPTNEPSFPPSPNENNALVPVGAQLIHRTDRLIFELQDREPGFIDCCYFYRDVDRIARVNKNNYDDIDETNDLPEF